MPNWADIEREIAAIKQSANTAVDATRKKYTKKLSETTNRNVIMYYSGWMQKSGNIDFMQNFGQLMQINDDDRNGFMQMFQTLDPEKDLDLILHTPGGDIAATEALIKYLVKKFPPERIRAIVPHTCMSGGTILALSCTEIIMAKHSSIGPIDPQLRGLGATSILKEIEVIHNDLKSDPGKIHIWAPILNKYNPTLIMECDRSIQWAKNIAKTSLSNGMCKKIDEERINEIVDGLIDFENTFNHSRQIDYNEAKSLGLNVKPLEDDQKLQDLVLTVHHCCMHSFTNTSCIKIIENSANSSYLCNANQQLLPVSI